MFFKLTVMSTFAPIVDKITYLMPVFFQKYDGERSANHFNLEDAKCLEPIVDCIESAVKKGRARLIEAERRNSGFTERGSPTDQTE